MFDFLFSPVFTKTPSKSLGSSSELDQNSGTEQFPVLGSIQNLKFNPMI
jgi:hypothetical protein